MSFLETQAMNQRFHEAEAVLLADQSNGALLTARRERR
jgi:hypothetical protein